MITITLAIVILTAIVSFVAFSNQKITNDLIFYPPAVSERNQWYRFLSCALVHADTGHLVFNMLSLYMFGRVVEVYFEYIFGPSAAIMYVALYVVAQFLCLIPTYLKHKHDRYYKSLGASGAVSAVVFAGIFFEPTQLIGIFIIPPIIPGFIFGPLYLIISAYLAKKGGDNINHSAHIWGSIAGLLFVIVTSYTIGHYDSVANFVLKVTSFL
jgi:membrane associated rhomboid family serine protease